MDREGCGLPVLRGHRIILHPTHSTRTHNIICINLKPICPPVQGWACQQALYLQVCNASQEYLHHI